MKRDIPIYFSEDELYLLMISINHYQEYLDESYKRSDYFYRSYRDEFRKGDSECNKQYVLVRSYHLDNLKARLMSYCPLPHDEL